MPNIKPSSDPRSYSEVLHDVTVGAPVFLAKNGHGKYAVVKPFVINLLALSNWETHTSKSQFAIYSLK